MHLRSHDHIWSPMLRKLAVGCFANLYLKMFEISLMCSTMTIPTTLRIMFTVLAEQVELEGRAPPLHCSPLKVSLHHTPLGQISLRSY